MKPPLNAAFCRARRIASRAQHYCLERKFKQIYEEFCEYTMIPAEVYRTNLRIVYDARKVQGCVVECGVWRGGMSAGMAKVLGPARGYFLFDSFEGLPPAEEIDGAAALAWQADKTSPQYFGNCTAECEFAKRAMIQSGAGKAEFIQGWFDQTVPAFRPPQPIAVLRLDGDWYASTMVCLQNLYRYVARDGVIIIDDYYTWDGCSKAVHDFLSAEGSTARLHQVAGVSVIRLQ